MTENEIRKDLKNLIIAVQSNQPFFSRYLFTEQTREFFEEKRLERLKNYNYRLDDRIDNNIPYCFSMKVAYLEEDGETYDSVADIEAEYELKTDIDSLKKIASSGTIEMKTIATAALLSSHIEYFREEIEYLWIDPKEVLENYEAAEDMVDRGASIGSIKIPVYDKSKEEVIDVSIDESIKKPNPKYEDLIKKVCWYAKMMRRNIDAKDFEDIFVEGKDISTLLSLGSDRIDITSNFNCFVTVIGSLERIAANPNNLEVQAAATALLLNTTFEEKETLGEPMKYFTIDLIGATNSFEEAKKLVAPDKDRVFLNIPSKDGKDSYVVSVNNPEWLPEFKYDNILSMYMKWKEEGENVKNSSKFLEKYDSFLEANPDNYYFYNKGCEIQYINELSLKRDLIEQVSVKVNLFDIKEITDIFKKELPAYFAPKELSDSQKTIIRVNDGLYMEDAWKAEILFKNHRGIDKDTYEKINDILLDFENKKDLRNEEFLNGPINSLEK